MERATQTLHRLTSMGPYDEAHAWDPPVDDPRVLRDLVVNDLDRLPWFYKRYPQPLPRLQPPRGLPATTAAAVDVLAGTADVARAELSLLQLSRVLHLSAGVVRASQRPYGTYLFRAAGSAGGRFPLEVYLAAPEGGPVPAGVYWYHPQDHSLVLVGPPSHGDSPVLVVTGVPWRTGWRYRERGYRHVYWDAGTMLSQLLAATDSAGITARLHTRFPVEGRLHLLAYALGASASGMTFADSLLPTLLGQPLDGLLLTCVGVPEYASAAGGMPGTPTSIRQVTPRF